MSSKYTKKHQCLKCVKFPKKNSKTEEKKLKMAVYLRINGIRSFIRGFFRCFLGLITILFFPDLFKHGKIIFDYFP